VKGNNIVKPSSSDTTLPVSGYAETTGDVDLRGSIS